MYICMYASLMTVFKCITVVAFWVATRYWSVGSILDCNMVLIGGGILDCNTVLVWSVLGVILCMCCGDTWMLLDFSKAGAQGTWLLKSLFTKCFKRFTLSNTLPDTYVAAFTGHPSAVDATIVSW